MIKLFKNKLQLLFLVLFLLSFGMLFFTEGPFQLGPVIADFSSILPQDLLIEDLWYGVYFQDAFVGYTHSFMKIQDIEEGKGYVLKNTSQLKLPVLGTVESVSFESTIQLLSNYDLKQAEFKLNSKGYSVNGSVKKDKGGFYSLIMRTPAQTIQKKVPMKDEMVNPMLSPLSLTYVPIKKEVAFNFYDPFLDRKTTVSLYNNGKKVINIGGKDEEVYDISMDMEGVEGKMFVDMRGRMVKEEFLGFTFVKQNALDLFRKEEKYPFSQDLVQYFTISAAALPDKENLNYLKLKITGIPAGYLREDFNQKVYPEADSFIVETHKKTPSQTVNLPINREGFEKYLDEDESVKFNDPALKSLVKSIVRDEKNTFEIIKKLSFWIDKNIKKTPTLSLPNTLDVLKMRQGDCGEMSVLLAGFLRSLGIPSYVNIGLVYSEGRFFYHAWVSVYTGEWIDTDPTLNQLTADPTHIKILEGFKNQFEIFKILGNLKIEILEYK